MAGRRPEGFLAGLPGRPLRSVADGPGQALSLCTLARLDCWQAGNVSAAGVGCLAGKPRPTRKRNATDQLTVICLRNVIGVRVGLAPEIVGPAILYVYSTPDRLPTADLDLPVSFRENEDAETRSRSPSTDGRMEDQ